MLPEETQHIVTLVALFITAILMINIMFSREAFAEKPKRDCSDCATAIVAKGRCNYLNMGGKACEVVNVKPIMEASPFWPIRCKGWKLPCLTEEEKKKKEEAEKAAKAPSSSTTPSKAAECFSFCGI
jgi:hypothetical protein